MAVGLLLSGCGSTPSSSSKTYKSSSAKQKSTAKYHRVRKGDTLYAVSWKVGVDYKTLARWNGLRAPYTIYPGQQLRLKPPAKSSYSASASSKKKTQPKKSTAKTTSSSKTSGQKKTEAKTSSATSSQKKTASKPVAKKKLNWMWPVKGKVVGTYSSSDASRDGIKIAGKKGKDVHATEAGQVVYVGSGLVGYGRLIIIKHNNIYLSAYGHNSKLLVREGDVVKRGQHIADMGAAHSGQALLHFEIRKYGKPVNPISYLP